MYGNGYGPGGNDMDHSNSAELLSAQLDLEVASCRGFAPPACSATCCAWPTQLEECLDSLDPTQPVPFRLGPGLA